MDPSYYGELRKAEAEIASLKSQLAALEVYRHEFRELMAIMHHDGGQYEAEHGPKKARVDALVEYYERIQRVDTIISVEFGFKCAEKGWNLERTLTAAMEAKKNG